MKNRIITLALLPVLLAACGPTRIVTYNPVPAATHYSTTIAPYRTRTTTTITQVYSKNEDISLQLDLQAVAALFAQAGTVEEFETMLNNGQYPVSNLDLNGDGYIDYLRVLETVDGYNHLFLIQAVLGDNIFQDVATLVAEVRSAYNYYFEVIGAPYIYGPNFIVRPKFYARPPIFEVLRRHVHVVWVSPWHWNHFPPHYRHPRPIFLNHYQAYVRTYMGGHPFCHEVFYPAAPRYKDYDRMTRSYQRNDFGNQHPERSFTTRNANTPNVGGQGNVKNAYDIRQNNEATKTTSTTDNRAATSVTTGRGTGATSGSSVTRSGSSSASGSVTRSSGSTSSSSGSVTRSNGSTTRSSGTSSGSVTRSSGASTSGSTTRSSGSSSSTVTRSKVSSSGASSTTTSPATTRSSSSGSATRSSGSTTRSSASSSSSTRSSSSSATRSSASSSTRTGSSSSATRSSSSSSTTRSSGAAASSTSRGRR